MARQEAPSGTAAAGCLVMIVGAGLGFVVWLYAPPSGYRWAFEGEGPREPYYVDLPLLVCGLPLLALCAWLVARTAVVRGRLGRWAPALAAGVALVALTWGASLYMAGRESDLPYGEEGI